MFTKTGHSLSYLRQQRELTQKNVAEMLGVHTQYVSNVERGIQLYPPHQLKKLVKSLKLNSGEKEMLLEFVADEITANCEVRCSRELKKYLKP